MHRYSTDSSRLFWVAYMGVAAAGLVFIGSSFLNSVVEPFLSANLPQPLSESLNQNIRLITISIALAAIFTVYNGLLWRFLSRWGRFEPIPDIQGVWVRVPKDELIDNDSEEENLNLSEGDPKLVIGQTWTEIEVGYVENGDEYWRSDTAAILVDDAPHPELVCTYQAESLGEDQSNLDRGTARLRYIDESEHDQLIGRRYTESGENNEGLAFVRKETSIIPPLIERENGNNS